MNSASVKEECSIRSQVKWVKIICLDSIFAERISFHEVLHPSCACLRADYSSQLFKSYTSTRKKNMAAIQIAVSYAVGDSRRIVSKQETNHIKSQALFEWGTFTFVADNTSRSCICVDYSHSKENTHLYDLFEEYLLHLLHCYIRTCISYLNNLRIYMRMNKTDRPPSKFLLRELFAQRAMVYILYALHVKCEKRLLIKRCREYLFVREMHLYTIKFRENASIILSHTVYPSACLYNSEFSREEYPQRDSV